jgi:hypothetical protein
MFGLQFLGDFQHGGSFILYYDGADLPHHLPGYRSCLGFRILLQNPFAQLKGVFKLAPGFQFLRLFNFGGGFLFRLSR